MVKRPPPEITAEEFFTSWLVREFAAEFGVGRRAASDITVAVKLIGEGGGEWVLDVRNGVLSVRDPKDAGPAPEVSMLQDLADWRAVAVGELGAMDLAPPDASPLDVLFVDPASRQIMTACKGTVRFEITGFAGRTWWMQVTFGQGRAEAEAVIRVDVETYADVLARKIAPIEAYFSGRISLSGNTGLAMQLGMAMLPRFIR